MFCFKDYKCAKNFVMKLARIIALSFIKTIKKTSIKDLILVFRYSILNTIIY